MDRSAPSELLIRQRLRALEKNLPAAARGNVDALHQARVATRRIREALPVVSAGSRGRRLERQMRKITQALGPVRDLDVALQPPAPGPARDERQGFPHAARGHPCLVKRLHVALGGGREVSVQRPEALANQEFRGS